MNTKLSVCQANKLVVCKKPQCSDKGRKGWCAARRTYCNRKGYGYIKDRWCRKTCGTCSGTSKIPKAIALFKKPGTPVKTCDVQKTVDCKACAKLTDEESGDLYVAGGTCILGFLEMRRCNKEAQKNCALASEKAKKDAKVKCATTDNCAHVSSAVRVIIHNKCELKCEGSAAKKCEEVALPY